MTNFPIGFFFFFIPMWFFILFILSKRGWSDLVENYKAEDPFTGDRIGIISAGINGVNYNNSLILKYNDEGIYLKTMFLFSAFHKPILIPWGEIKEVRNWKILFYTFKELIIGDPFVATIKLRESAFNKIKDAAPIGFHKFD
jgi:hypothetical protein